MKVTAQAAAAGLTADDARGLLYDRDTVAFYGDPAWVARMADEPKYFDQTLKVKGDTYTLTSHGAPVNVHDNTINLTAAAGGKSPRFRQSSSGQTRLNAEAHTIRLTADADTPNDQFYISIDLKDALVDVGDTPSPQADFSRPSF